MLNVPVPLFLHIKQQRLLNRGSTCSLFIIVGGNTKEEVISQLRRDYSFLCLLRIIGFTQQWTPGETMGVDALIKVVAFFFFFFARRPKVGHSFSLSAVGKDH